MFSDCSFCHRFEEKLFSYKFAVVAVVHISNLRFFFSFFFNVTLPISGLFLTSFLAKADVPLSSVTLNATFLNHSKTLLNYRRQLKLYSEQTDR